MKRGAMAGDIFITDPIEGNPETVPIADPSIMALEAWHLISARTLHCLERRSDETDPASTVADVPIESMRLSDLAKLELKDIIRIPNLGRTCLCEIAVMMKRYGWRFRSPGILARDIFDHPVFSGLQTLLDKVARATKKRQSAFERGRMMLEMSSMKRLTASEVGEHFGVSSAVAQVSMQNARQIKDRRSRFPLPPRH